MCGAGLIHRQTEEQLGCFAWNILPLTSKPKQPLPSCSCKCSSESHAHSKGGTTMSLLQLTRKAIPRHGQDRCR